ncbi:MAG: hypothetical protein B7X91_06800 [Hydrogenophilales bacterium 17-64-11]|nr:MAG: hypothetical protein B7X91_06800 [Hydrogenophilales bacterium 17-64-11]
MTIRLRLCSLAFLLLAAPAAAEPSDPGPEWRYTLRPGDTLIGVSARYLARPADWPRVQRHNRIANPYRLVPGSALRIPLAWLRHAPAPATVVAVTGQVRLSLPDGAERALQAGDRLAAGASLSSAANSSATLRFADDSVAVLQPGARMTLDSVSVYAGGGMVDTRLRLQQGRLDVGANPRRTPGSRLQVITPSAVAAVRGTRFRVAAEPRVTREETLEGEVGLAAAGQRVAVMAGQGSLAEAGKPPRPPAALLPAPDVSALPLRVESLPLRFTLPALPGAVSWLGQIASRADRSPGAGEAGKSAADAQFGPLLLEHASASPRLSFADLPDGRYVLRTRAADALGLQGRDAVHAFELDARPFAPLLRTPGARVRSAQPALQWSAVVGATAYRVELARDAAFSEMLLTGRTTETRLAPPGELAPGAYHWRVASIEADEQGPFSPPQRFVYDPLPGAPDLGQAAPAFEQNSLKLALPPPPAGLRYELVLARDAERTRIVWQGSSRDGRLHASPLDAATYYLAARLVEADGTAGPYATRVIEAPPRLRWEALLLLLPLLAM